MHAMVLTEPRSPLRWTELPDRRPRRGEIRVTVSACAVCRTDLHVIDGLPLNEEGIEHAFTASLSRSRVLGQELEEAFRISLAGAQERPPCSTIADVGGAVADRLPPPTPSLRASFAISRQTAPRCSS